MNMKLFTSLDSGEREKRPLFAPELKAMPFFALSTEAKAFVEFESSRICISLDHVTIAFLDKNGDPNQSNHMAIYDIDEKSVVISVGADRETPLIPSSVKVYGCNDWGQGYSFESRITAAEWRETSGGKKIKVWILDRPRTVERNQRRNAFRLDVSIPATLTWEMDDATFRFKATIVDISFTGCRAQIDFDAQRKKQAGIDLLESFLAAADPRLSLTLPEDFISREQAQEEKRRQGRVHIDSGRPAAPVAKGFTDLPVEVVITGKKKRPHRDPVFFVGLKFQENKQINKLIRFLERQILQRLRS